MTKPRRVSKSKHQEAPITRLRLPKGIKTIIVFGGSFDPPTTVHEDLCGLNAFMDFPSNSTLVLCVPVAKSPFKPDGPVASDVQRVAMLREGTEMPVNSARTGTVACIWTDELDRCKWQKARGINIPSYTIDTIRRLRSIVPKRASIRLLIGADQAVQFHKWKEPELLQVLAEPLVLLRPPLSTPKLFLDALQQVGLDDREVIAWAKRIIPDRPSFISATSIRERLPFMPLNYAGWFGHVTGQLSYDVAQYIMKHRLYGVGTRYKPKQAKPSRKR